MHAHQETVGGHPNAQLHALRTTGDGRCVGLHAVLGIDITAAAMADVVTIPALPDPGRHGHGRSNGGSRGDSFSVEDNARADTYTDRGTHAQCTQRCASSHCRHVLPYSAAA